MRSNPPTPNTARAFVVMGVSGSGKTEVGCRLATALGGRFFDSDAFHPSANIAKMRAGIPLTDADRWPWYERLRAEVIDACPPGETRVLACSALRRVHRDFLRATRPQAVRFIHLIGSYELILERLAARQGHFMPADLLRSQFEALEAPDADEAMAVSIDRSPDEIVAGIVRRL